MDEKLDILKEVMTTASAHGSGALYKMLGHKINLELPQIQAIDAASIMKHIKADEVVLSVECKILSGLGSRVLMTLDEKSAYRLINACSRHSEGLPEVFTEMVLSTVKEIGNVVIGAYLNALSIYLKAVIIPAPPTLLSGTFGHIMKSALNLNQDSYILMVEAVFSEQTEKITGAIQMIITQKDMDIIQAACKNILDDINKP